MSSYAITGASKGIGLEYVRQAAATSANVVLAIVRDPKSPAIAKLASSKSNIHIIKGDVTDPKSLLDAAKAVGAITGNKLDVLIHNSNAMDTATAFLSPSQVPLDVEATQAMFDLSFRTAIYGSLWTTNAFLPLIENGREKKIVYISTGMADLDLITAAGISYAVPYGVAKAGMNVQVAKYAVELKPKDIKVLALSPGWVDTWDGEKPPEVLQGLKSMLQQFQRVEPELKEQIQVEESVRKQLQVIASLNAEMSGSFLSHNGDKQWF